MPKQKVVKKTTITTEIIEETIGEKTQIVCVLDRSGTMNSIIDVAIDGFNEYINKQKLRDDEATMTVALFDDYYDLLYENVPIKEVPLFTKDVWFPRGMTALHDAVCMTIKKVQESHKKMKKKDRPDKVLFCVVTDGLENYSQEYDLNDVVRLTRECEDDGWSFVYLAANQDAFNVGQKMGVQAGNTYSFDANSSGVLNLTTTLDNATTYVRSATAGSVEYSQNSNNLMTTFGVEDEE